jgi:hypothetical protein
MRMKPKNAQISTGIACCMLAALLLCRCGADRVAGGSSDHGNAFAYGVAVDSSGAPQSGVAVFALPSGHDPLKSPGLIASDTTAADGEYAVGGLFKGSYNILASRNSGSEQFLRQIALSDNDSANLDRDTLRAPGSVLAAIPSNADRSSGYVYIPGTFSYRKLSELPDTASFVLLDLVPSAPSLDIEYTAETSPESPITIAESVAVYPADTSARSLLPSPWQQVSCGETGAKGGAAYSNGQFVIGGGGPDIWNAADGFYFVYQQMSGNAQITARVTRIEPVDTFAKAGVMIRQSLDPACPDAAMSLIFNIDPLVPYVTELHVRETAGDSSTFVQDSSSDTVQISDPSAPIWLRITRTGNLIEGYVSKDGTSWHLAAQRQIAMSDPVFVGLAVTSHAASKLNTSTFDSVSIQ